MDYSIVPVRKSQTHIVRNSIDISMLEIKFLKGSKTKIPEWLLFADKVKGRKAVILNYTIQDSSWINVHW